MYGDFFDPPTQSKQDKQVKKSSKKNKKVTFDEEKENDSEYTIYII